MEKYLQPIKDFLEKNKEDLDETEFICLQYEITDQMEPDSTDLQFVPIKYINKAREKIKTVRKNKDLLIGTDYKSALSGFSISHFYKWRNVSGNIMKAINKIVIILFLLLISCNSKEKGNAKKYGDLTEADYKADTITVDGKEVYRKTAITENDGQTKVDFSSKDNAWLVKNITNAKTLKDMYWEKPMPKEKEFMPTVLDEVFIQWMKDDSKTKKDQDFVVNSLGVAFGQYLVDNYNMKWIIVSDSYGTDYAVIHKKWNIIAYPLSSVNKGINQNKENFFHSIELSIKQQISEGNKGNIQGN